MAIFQGCNLLNQIYLFIFQEKEICASKWCSLSSLEHGCQETCQKYPEVLNIIFIYEIKSANKNKI